MEMYTDVRGTTVITDDGRRGTTVLLGYDGLRTTGAFIALDEGGMLYAALGKSTAGPCDCLHQLDERAPHSGQCRTRSERLTHHEVDSIRAIDRDEFDQLTGLAEARRSMGWRDSEGNAA